MPLLRAEKINTQPPKGKQNLKVVGRIPRKNTFHFTNGDGAQQGPTIALLCVTHLAQLGSYDNPP